MEIDIINLNSLDMDNIEEDFKVRLKNEFDELYGRIVGLKQFMKGGFGNLKKKVGFGQAFMLYIQRFMMICYLATLAVRLDDLGIKHRLS